MRIIELFNENWHFCKEDLLNDHTANNISSCIGQTQRYRSGPASINYNGVSAKHCEDGILESKRWEYVTLPHDFIITQQPTKGESWTLGHFKYQNAWYRKCFTLPKEDEGKRIYLEFDGIATNATVYLNGCLLKHNFCGYTSFDVDITDFVLFDESNVLAVYVDTKNNEGWWYEGGGIYRDVRIVKTDEIAIDRYGVYVKSEKMSQSEWSLTFETTLASIADSVEKVTLITELLDAENKVVLSLNREQEVLSREKTIVTQNAKIDNPILWDVDNPYLYTVRTRILRNGKMTDEYTTRTGFRTFLCDPDKGFFLNGRNLKIKGVCAHENCGLLGKAIPKNVHRYKMELIKEMGANGYRTSHYQQHSAILDAADELGFIVLDETRWFSSSEEHISQLVELVKRDRNRPSVFFWSIGNEEEYQILTQGKKIAKTLRQTIRHLDKTRPVTYCCNQPVEEVIFDELDIMGINYYPTDIDSKHKQRPNLPVLSTENCATGTTRGWYWDDCPQKGYISAYDHQTSLNYRSREYMCKFIMERPFMMGGYQWDAIEHRGEGPWPRLCSQAGAIDMYLQKKDAFYQNQSHWLQKPMIHLLPHWNVDVPEGECVKIFVYTNCEEAELILNGKSLGRKKCEKFTHLEWDVPYEKGKITAVGYNEGKIVAEESHETASSPKKLVLKVENDVKELNDIAIVTCYTVDDKGRFVPTASPEVEFFTNSFGKIAGTGSDVCDHTPAPSLTRKMREGYITVAVGVATNRGKYPENGGTVELYAKSPELESAKITIKFE